jgi:hypothetical protein
MVRISNLLCVYALLVGCALPGFAQEPAAAAANEIVPRMVNFSGVLTDVNGKPLTGVVGATFYLYKDSQGGAPLWMETQNVRPTSNGHYSVMLGSTTSTGLPSNLFVAGEARWLAVQVNGQEEQPRVLLLSVPYALKAADAETLGGLPLSAFVLAAPSTSGAAAASGTAAPVAASVPASASAAPPVTSNVTTTGGTVSTFPMFTTATNIQNSILTQTGTTAINVGGILNLPATGTATAVAGKNSQAENHVASAFNSTTLAAVNQTFQWRAEPAGNNTATPSGTLNLLFGSGAALPTETGLKLSSKGLFTFAAGQTFPGAGTITGVLTAVGSGLSGGGTTGTLNLKVPAAGITNAMLANSKITLSANAAGGITAPGAMTLGGTSTIGLKACAASQILQFSGTVWNCANAGVGTITGITTAAGSGLTGGGTSGTLNLKVPAGGITNAMLQNSSLTVTAGTGLSGGGLVSLGGTDTLSVNPAVVPELALANTFSNNNAISVSSANPALSIGNAGIGDGIDIAMATGGGFGVLIQGSSFEGVRAVGQTFPLVGFGGSGEGVFGETTTDSNFQPGILGIEGGATQITLGVEGFSSSTSGAGIYGQAIGSSTEGGTIAGSGAVGVWGDTSADFGVLGTVDEGDSIVGFNASEPFATGYFQNDETASATAPVLVAVGGNIGGACMFDVSGDMFCSGSKSAVVSVDSGARKVAMYAVESPKNWFEDFGSARLSNGSVAIAFESTFAQTVNTGTYHVFLTPSGDCKGLFVSQKSAGGFEVRELGGGTSNIAFDYRIVAERRGFENIRMADKTALFRPGAMLKKAMRRSSPLRAPVPQRPKEPARASVVRPAIGSQGLKTK